MVAIWFHIFKNAHILTLTQSKAVASSAVCVLKSQKCTSTMVLNTFVQLKNAGSLIKKKKNTPFFFSLLQSVQRSFLKIQGMYPKQKHFQSYRPSCSHTSTRKFTISDKGIGWGKGCLVPSKLSYVARQLIFAFRLCWVSSVVLVVLLPIHCSLVWFQRRRPWFTNSEELLTLPPILLWLRVRFDVLIDEMLRWDWMVLLSKSHVLVLQKPSDMLGFLTIRPWILNPLDGSSTAIIGVGLVQHPKQPPMQANKRLIHAAKELFSITMVDVKPKAQRRASIEGKPKPSSWKEIRVDFGARKLKVRWGKKRKTFFSGKWESTKYHKRKLVDFLEI